MRTEYRRATIYRIIRDAGRPLSLPEIAAIAGGNPRATGKIVNEIKHEGWVLAFGDLAHRTFTISQRPGEPRDRRGRNGKSADNLGLGRSRVRLIPTRHKTPQEFYNLRREGTPGEIARIPTLAELLTQ